MAILHQVVQIGSVDFQNSVDDCVLNNGHWVDLVEQMVVASWVHALLSIQCKCNEDEVKHGHLREKRKIKIDCVGHFLREVDVLVCSLQPKTFGWRP